ncbi:MAG TPA: hypothetical protein VG826_25835 [Pirellulales bacterium]|nr:hypothetical protein [Pirellulales bacterium]
MSTAWLFCSMSTYQTYVAALGTAEMTYATDNAAQFDNEITTIDAADKAAADDTANTDETLSTTLTNDEAAFEGSLAEEGAAYQAAIGQSAQDYRQGVAQANHDLIVETAENNPEALTDYDNEMADALEAKFAAIDLAYSDFATEVDPAMTLQGTDDADAEETDSETIASTN